MNALRSALVLFCALPVAAQQQQRTLRAWGDDTFGPTLTALERAYHAQHPNITFADKLTGSGTGMAGIITGVSDITIMGRAADTNEIIGFEWVHRTKPYGIQIANGPLQGDGRSPALTVFVSRTNPVPNITTAQLASLLSCPATHAAPTWADAGATGTFATHPVHLYTYDITSGTGAFLQQTLTPDHDCWNWDIVHEFRDRDRSGKPYPAAAQIADALRHDPDGLDISTQQYASPSIKPIALNGIVPTAATLTDASYPLTRPIFFYVERKANAPLDPEVAAFLRFILSPEGQRILASQHDFLPLSPTTFTAQRTRLD